MAIFGIGTDLVQVTRIRDLLARHPRRFPARILHAAERAELAGQGDPAAFLARRFAAKEAAAKALGTGIAQGVRFDDFQVDHHPGGRPRLVCHGRAAELLAAHAVTACHLSLADDGGYAMAWVIFET